MKWIFLAAALVASGCGSQAGGGAEKPETAPMSETEIANQAAFERIMGRADCAIEAQSGPPEEPFAANPCRLNPNGGENPTDRHILIDFEEGLAPGAETGSMTITLVSPTGEVIQEFRETGLPRYFYPQMQDIDSDGALDLLVTRDVGNVNAVRAIYHAETATRQYTRVGEVSAIAFQPTSDGLIAAPSRSSAASLEIRFLAIDGGALLDRAVVEVSAKGQAADGGVLGLTCKLMKAPGAKDVAAREAAEKKFCADPAAAKAFE